MNIELEAYKNQQYKVLGEFLHELKTPLSIIRTHLETEISNEHIPLSVRKKIVMDVEEVARLTQLIAQMKTLLSCDTTALVFTSSSLLALLVDVIELLNPLAQEKEQKLRFIAHENIDLEMDVDKCKQLFYNLIHNAIKYTPNKGSIEVNLSQTNEAITVRIEDDGIGIKVDEREAIFEQFYRGSNTTTQEGTGLGLALSKVIVEGHKGRIFVEEVDVKGSVFCVIFPKVSCR